MVFESIVTDLMNRFLGDFIENLDKKQLNIGIWGGDVILKNLQLKQSALKELNLPVQTIYGTLGKLVLKIPWKNLYTLPVEADVEDLYLLVAPNAAVSYDAEKQEKADLEAKKLELQKIDDAQKRELEKDKPKADKSFTEKLVAQIINNVQIRIRNVHIRYEDRSTSSIPFAFGITLGGLEVHTTDADWKKAFLSEALSKVFKVAVLDGLAVYMNCNTTMFQSYGVDEYNRMFMETIATYAHTPTNFSYVLGPINSVAKLKLNMNPELDVPAFQIPKVDLFLEMEKLAVGITKSQYQRLIEVADGMGTMKRGIPYRQYRPNNTPFKGNAKVWWKFAYTCIVETEIKRRKNNWSWNHIIQHRETCRSYSEMLKTTKMAKKPSIVMLQTCEQYEQKIDLFNLLLIRKRVNLEVEKSDKIEAAQQQTRGWFSGWWGGSSNSNQSESNDIIDQFKTAMTADEKAKLFKAIGYHEDGEETELPIEYTAIVAQFKLKMLEICIRNESLTPLDTNDTLTVLSFQILGVSCDLDQRPAASGLKVDMSMNEFTVFGRKHDDYLPVMVKSKIGSICDRSLIDVKFEMNPIDKLCDQRVTVAARPLEIVYDAETIIQLLQVFKMPSNTNLSELTDAASDKISNIKERSATGIQYMVEKHTSLEVNINVMPNYVVIPYGGSYHNEHVPVLVISLGELSLKSLPKSNRQDVASLHGSGRTAEDILHHMLEQAYDKFALNIQNIQVLLATPGENWKEILTEGRVSDMHILEPTTLLLSADLCVVDDDPRLPKTRVSGEIPTIGISIAEDRALDLLALATSIPLPENDDTKPMALTKEAGFISSTMSVKKYLDDKQLKKIKKNTEIKKHDLSEEIIQYTDLEFNFILNELIINIYRANDMDSTPTSQYRTPTEEFENAIDGSLQLHRQSIFSSAQVSRSHSGIGGGGVGAGAAGGGGGGGGGQQRERKITFQVKHLEMGMVQRTYDMKVLLKLGAIIMNQYRSDDAGKMLTMIETPTYADKSGYLFSLNYTNANKISPEFTTKYKSTEQLVEINFSILILRLHQERLSELLKIISNFQTKIDKITNKAQKDRIGDAGEPAPCTETGPGGLATITEEPNSATTVARSSSTKNMATVVDSIKLKLIAEMKQVAILIECDKRPISDLRVENLTAGIIMKTSYTEVNVRLQDIVVKDLNTQTIHPTILTVVGGNAIECQIVLYNLSETSVYNSDDMKIDVSMGCVKIVFLNWFVNSMLNFLDQFQSAQRALADASAAAAETAKQNMVEAYSNATRMRLNIRIKAPIIVVPVDSQSLQGLSIDFGYLCITNTCSEIPNSARDRGAAILDEMKLELNDMKLSKIQIRPTSVVSSGGGGGAAGTIAKSIDETDGDDDVNILNPTSFALIIKRNLSGGWYKEIPELNVSGRLKSIVVNLLADDYKLVMSILAKNMTEGADERPPAPLQPPKSPQKSDIVPLVTTTTAQLQDQSAIIKQNLAAFGDDEESAAKAWDVVAKKHVKKPAPFGVDISNQLAQKQQSPQQKIDTFLKFSFQMDSIVLNLLTETNLGLASFGIHHLSLKGAKLVDESMSCSLILCDVQLDDTRPERQNQITKFMKKRETGNHDHDSSKPITSMVDIVARITETEIFANLKVSSFDLILSLEFLFKVLQFVTIPPTNTDNNVQLAIANKTTAAIVAAPNIPVATATTTTATTTSKTLTNKATDSTPPGKQMTILLKVEQPDIILVETMDDINCLALILNTEIELRVRILDAQQIIQGGISDLKLYICEFNPAKRNATKHFVLQPCNLTLHAATPESRGMNISLTCSDIRLNISPAIIELLNKTVTTLTSGGGVTDENTMELPDYSDIWGIKSFADDDFWFMKIDDAQDVLTLDCVSPVVEHLPEICIIEVPSIVLVIETGLGYYTYPMLVLETKMNAEVRDWSSEISISSSLTLGMAYYNSTMAVWEPLIEPNEREKSNGLTEYGPWELNFNLKIEKNLDDTNVSSAEPEPKTKISICSSDTLEITVTKTCLDVLQDLGKAFSDAIRPEGLHKPDLISPYIVENDTGFDITLNLKTGALNLHSSHLPHGSSSSNKSMDDATTGVIFQTTQSTSSPIEPEQVTTCKISPGGRAFLQSKQETSLRKISAFSSLNATELQEMFLHVKIGDIDKEVTLPIHKADRRYFPLYRDTKHEPWGIISNVKTEYGSTVITIHGVLKIQNHFSTPINIFRLKNGTFDEIGTVKPGDVFNVPLYALYAIEKELYFSVAGYKISIQGINWKESPSDFKFTKYIQCDPEHTFEPFYITAIREREEVYYEITSKHTMLSACYIIHLKPPVYLRNALPIDISISVAGCSVAQTENGDEAKELEETTVDHVLNSSRRNLVSQQQDFLDYGEKVVKPGDVLHLPTVKTTVKAGEMKSFIVARLVQYLEKDWSCTTEIPSTPPEFAVWTFCSYDSVEKMTLELGVKFDNQHGNLQLIVYCPFWMINKTGLILSYRGADENVNVLYHPPELEGPILFSYREKLFFGKKRASVRVDAGEWSDRFALDAAGSTGVVECKTNDITYEIAVHNTLTSNSLTKQIMFVPMYVLMNKAPFTIQVQEDRRPADKWIKIEPDQCVPLWPKNKTDRMLRVKTIDDTDASSAFRYNEVQTTLLKMKNKYGGINVDVQVTEGGIYIIFSEYHRGDAPALIINHTDKLISFWEKGNVNERQLQPYENMLYTWADPAGPRCILWDEGDKHIENDLRRDGLNQLKTRNHKTDEYFWVSFLDGTQRVLLFTNNATIATEAHSANRLDQVSQEIEVDIHGVGLSLVNNIKQVDIMYIGIASSGVIWEEMKKLKYFKAMKIQEVQIMEERYQEYLRDRQVGTSATKSYYLHDANKGKIDFDNMVLHHKSSERSIRRTFYPGLWINKKSSPYQMQLHAKINRIQIDNQLADCIFPVVLAPVPPPRSVAATTILKPFIECSIVQRIIPHSDVKQFKYLTMLTQEFHVKVDLIFINEIVEMVSTELSDEESLQRFAEDIQRQQKPLSTLALTHSSQEQKNFYDQIHLGPLKIHISFSMAGLEPGALPGVLSTILQGVGVTLTDINDIVFRLSFFEREYTFFTQRQLISEITSHYTGQAVKQAYVLILGLDVIGNPYGLVIGLTKGVEDLFYEPFHGAIQGPGEFAEGLVLGVRSLFGHTVGGAAGAVSKITGAMGKGLAALTFDKDYQKKRRENMNKQPANLHEGLARSGKGLVMGVVDGVTGVFTKPISGAKSEGVEGFFKGLGKGAVGLVARPTAGIVDFASDSFGAVKRAAEMSEEINRLRAPRFLNADGIVRPFCIQEAEGNKLLKEIEKGKYANTDTFDHYEVIIEKRDVLLLSDQRILYCIKNDLFGGWQVDWTYRWNEISKTLPTDRGVEIIIGEKNKKMLGLFGSSEQQKKLILIQQTAKRIRLAQIMDKLKKETP